MDHPTPRHVVTTVVIFVASVISVVALGAVSSTAAAFGVAALMSGLSIAVAREVVPILPAESRKRALLDTGFSVLIITGSFWNLLLVVDVTPRQVSGHVAVAAVIASMLAPIALSVTGMLNDPTEIRFRRLTAGTAVCVIAGMAWAAGPAAGGSSSPFAMLAPIGLALLLRAVATPATGTRPRVDVMARLERRRRVVAFLHVLYVVTLVVAMWTTDRHEVMGTVAAMVLVLAFVTQHAAGRENLDLHRQLATRLEELERSEDRLRTLADTDELTRLVNRRSFVELLTSHLARRHPCAVLFVDLDRFKEINDSLGHDAGDEVLVEVARRLRGALGPTATIGRFGGDEFVVLIPDVAADGAAVAWGKRLLRALAEPTTVRGVETFLAASIGVALAESGSSAVGLLRDADVAMYVAKEQGRNGVAVFDPALLAAAEDRLQIAGELHRAMGGNEFEPYFQPIVDADGGRLRGFEALVRWNHPTRGVVGPDAFLEAAENTGVIVAMGEAIVRTACRWLGEWTRRGLIAPDVGVAVNLAPRQLLDRSAVDMVSAAIIEAGIEPGRLSIEITESALMAEGTEVDSVIGRLRDFGVRFSADDFGTGYSSLTYLKRFPVDTLKIDRDFVAGLPAESGDAVIVDAIIGLAHALGLTTVAEGVERADQLEYLRDRGCRRVQGYLVARPLPALDMERWLADQTQSAGPAILHY